MEEYNVITMKFANVAIHTEKKFSNAGYESTQGLEETNSV